MASVSVVSCAPVSHQSFCLMLNKIADKITTIVHLIELHDVEVLLVAGKVPKGKAILVLLTYFQVEGLELRMISLLDLRLVQSHHARNQRPWTRVGVRMDSFTCRKTDTYYSSLIYGVAR